MKINALARIATSPEKEEGGIGDQLLGPGSPRKAEEGRPDPPPVHLPSGGRWTGDPEILCAGLVLNFVDQF